MIAETRGEIIIIVNESIPRVLFVDIRCRVVLQSTDPEKIVVIIDNYYYRSNVISFPLINEKFSLYRKLYEILLKFPLCC